MRDKQIRRKRKRTPNEFLKETIKAKPWNRKKLAKQVGKLLASGAVFGLVAAVVFSVAAPAMTGKILEKKDASKVTFPQEEDQEEEGEADAQNEELPEVRAEGTPLLLWHRT